MANNFYGLTRILFLLLRLLAGLRDRVTRSCLGARLTAVLVCLLFWRETKGGGSTRQPLSPLIKRFSRFRMLIAQRRKDGTFRHRSTR